MSLKAALPQSRAFKELGKYFAIGAVAMSAGFIANKYESHKKTQFLTAPEIEQTARLKDGTAKVFCDWSTPKGQPMSVTEPASMRTLLSTKGCSLKLG